MEATRIECARLGAYVITAVGDRSSYITRVNIEISGGAL
jgi:hypothetical protein